MRSLKPRLTTPAVSRMVARFAKIAPTRIHLMTFRPSSTLLHAEQEDEEEDVIVEQAALELDAARDEVITLDTR